MEQMTQLCFVLVQEAEAGELSQVGEVVSEIFGSEFTAEVGEKGVITVNRDREAIGFLAHVPAPIPNGEAEACADGNFLWPNGKEEAGQHRSHVVVTQSGDLESNPVQSALTVTRLALVALRVFDGIGVYWGNASVSHARETFEMFAEDLSEDSVPVGLWLRFQFLRAADDEIGLYTLGMQQFGLMDLEVERCPTTPEDLFNFTAGLAQYLIQTGPVIEDGNTVGGSEEERILVRHLPSMLDESRTVYKIVFDR